MRHPLHNLFLTLAIAASALSLQSCAKSDPEKSPQRVFLSEIRSVNKLILGGMEISKMASIDDPSLSDAKNPRQAANAVLASLKIGDRKAVYSYSTYMRAYIDLSALPEENISVDEENKTLSIVLPPVMTEFAGRDIDIEEEHYRVTGLRSQINPEERAALKEKMNVALKNEVRTNSDYRNALVAMAKNRAVSYFEQLAAAGGYTANVSFEN